MFSTNEHIMRLKWHTQLELEKVFCYWYNESAGTPIKNACRDISIFNRWLQSGAVIIPYMQLSRHHHAQFNSLIFNFNSRFNATHTFRAQHWPLHSLPPAIQVTPSLASWPRHTDFAGYFLAVSLKECCKWVGRFSCLQVFFADCSCRPGRFACSRQLSAFLTYLICRSHTCQPIYNSNTNIQLNPARSLANLLMNSSFPFTFSLTYAHLQYTACWGVHLNLKSAIYPMCTNLVCWGCLIFVIFHRFRLLLLCRVAALRVVFFFHASPLRGDWYQMTKTVFSN